MLLSEFYYEIYSPQKLRGASTETHRLYRIALNQFGRVCGHEPRLSDLTDAQVSRFAVWRRSQGRAPQTINRDLASLLALWRHAHRLGMVKNYPTVQLDPEPQETPEAWSREQLQALFAACQAQTGLVGGVDAAGWWVGLHFILWDTGERIGAVLKLEWSDIDLSRRFCNFRAATRKGGMKGRKYPLAPDTAKALRAIQKPARKLLFPWSQDYGYLWKCYEKILNQAGLPSGRKSKFHRMRKSVASWAEAAGADATKLLGHSSTKITRAYLDPTIVHQQSPVQVLFRPA